MTRDEIIADLKKNGGILVEPLHFHFKTGEHSFFAYWLSDRSYCGLCGGNYEPNPNCKHGDESFHGQVFLCNLALWIARHGGVDKVREVRK
jgi:hypothetical protein